MIGYEVVKDQKVVLYPPQNAFLMEPFVTDLDSETVSLEFKMNKTAGSVYVMARPKINRIPQELSLKLGPVETRRRC